MRKKPQNFKKERKLKMKKLIALLLAVLMLLSVFTACAEKPAEPTPDPAPSTPTDPTPADPADPTDPTDPVEPTLGKQADGSFIYEDGVVMSAPGEYPIVKEGHVVLDVGMFWEGNVTSYEYGVNEFTTYLQDRSGIELNMVRMGSTSAESGTQFQLRIATGEELPDIMLNYAPSRLDCWDYMEDGIILPLNEYIENYSFYYNQALELMAEYNPELLGSIGAMNDPDGNQPTLWKYALGIGSQYDKHAYINKVWLDNLGLEMPETIDELYEVLVAFRDKDPNGNGLKDEIPMMGAAPEGKGVYTPNVCDVILNAFVYFSPRQHLIDQGDGKLTFVSITDEFREGIKWIRKCVEEGLIPDFSFTQDNAAQKAITDPVDPEAPTVVGVAVEGVSFAFNYAAGSERVKEYVPLVPPTGPKGVQYSSVYDTAMINQNIITGDCEYPEIAYRFMEMMYDFEVYNVMQNGTPGKEDRWMTVEQYADYMGVEVSDIHPSVGCHTIIGIDLNRANAYSDNHCFSWAIIPIYYIPTGFEVVSSLTALNEPDYTQASQWASLQTYEASKMRAGKLPATHVPGNLLNGLTSEEEVAASSIRGNLNLHFFNTRTQFQTGELDIFDDAVWQAYLDQLEAYGMSTCLKIYQQCYDRYLANSK